MKFSLIGGEQTYYQETMPATTDKFGNISVMVGTGSQQDRCASLLSHGLAPCLGCR